MEAANVAPQVQTFQIAILLDCLRVQCAHQARGKGIDLRNMPSKAAVHSDRALQERIVSNFVGNAIRCTDVGRVLVGCWGIEVLTFNSFDSIPATLAEFDRAPDIIADHRLRGDVHGADAVNHSTAFRKSPALPSQSPLTPAPT